MERRGEKEADKFQLVVCPNHSPINFILQALKLNIIPQRLDNPHPTVFSNGKYIA
jgi:hypothetical protein